MVYAPEIKIGQNETPAIAATMPTRSESSAIMAPSNTPDTVKPAVVKSIASPDVTTTATASVTVGERRNGNSQAQTRSGTKTTTLMTVSAPVNAAITSRGECNIACANTGSQTCQGTPSR